MNKFFKIVCIILIWLALATITGLFYSNHKIGKYDVEYFFKGISIYSTGAVFVVIYLIYKIIKDK